MLKYCRPLLLLLAVAAPGHLFAADIHRELEDIAKRLTSRIEETGRTNVAVADFTDLNGNVSQLGRFISEEVSTNMVVSARGFSVIDRNHLRTILKEQKLSMSGLMDPENQKKLGKILGVDALVLGSITPFGESYRVTFKVVATDTARVVTADRGMVPKTPATDELWQTFVSDHAPASNLTPATQQTSDNRRAAPQTGTFETERLAIKVDNLVALKDGQFRLVGAITNKTNKPLRVMIIQPTQFLDGLGNVAKAISSVGILICGNDDEYQRPKDCDRYYGDRAYTSLVPEIPHRFATTFQNKNQDYSLGSPAQLVGRILIHAGDAYTDEPFNLPVLNIRVP